MTTRIPRWIMQRCERAELRCIDPREPGRVLDHGIKFGFSNPRAMAEYLVSIGLDDDSRHMRAVRINQLGHYEPGNLELRPHYERCST